MLLTPLDEAPRWSRAGVLLSLAVPGGQCDTVDPVEVSSSILRRVALGNLTAVQACMNRFGPLVWALARRYTRSREDAEDAVQEIFMEVWRSAARYDPARGSEAVFITVLARRKLIDRLRAQSLQLRTEPLSNEIVDSVFETRSGSDLASEVASAARAIASLPPQQRDVLLLSTVEGRSHAEIAETTGLPLGTVKTFLRRGLIKVRQLLSPELADGSHDTQRAEGEP